MSAPQKSFSETELSTIRQHGSALIFPVLILGLVAALFFFVDPRVTLPWQHQTALAVCLVLVLIFWLLPSVRYFSNRYVLTSNRIVVHSGLVGRESDQASWNEINGVSVSKSFLSLAGNIHLQREFGADLVLTKVGSAKKIGKAIEAHLATRSKTKAN